MYAIVRTGGKQYRVEEGRTIEVDRLPAEEGATVELGDVLLIAEDGTTTVGTPTIAGARVLAQVDKNGRGPKIIVFKYKNKVRTRKKQGHRQDFTRLTVQEILRQGEEAKAKPPRARRRKAEEEAEAPAAVAEAPVAEAEGVLEEAVAETPVEEVAEAPAAEEAPMPKTTSRRAAPAKEKPAAKAEKPKRPAAKKAPAKDDKDSKPPARRRILRRKKED